MMWVQTIRGSVFDELGRDPSTLKLKPIVVPAVIRGFILQLALVATLMQRPVAAPFRAFSPRGCPWNWGQNQQDTRGEFFALLRAKLHPLLPLKAAQGRSLYCWLGSSTYSYTYMFVLYVFVCIYIYTYVEET